MPFSHSAAPLGKIPYVDHPEIKIDEHESTQMPFRYVATGDGDPVMPEVIEQLNLCRMMELSADCSHRE